MDFVIRPTVKETSAEDQPEEVTVEISSDNGFDPNAVLVVRRVLNGEEEFTDVKGYAEGKEKVAVVYDVKLLLGDQPIVTEDPITIKMYIPESMRGKDFSVINVSGEAGERVEYEVEGDYVVLTTTTLDIFAFVYEETDLTWLIILIAILLAAAIALLAYLIVKYVKNGKESKKGVFGFAPLFFLGATVPVAQTTALIVLGVILGCVLIAAGVIFFLLKKKNSLKPETVREEQPQPKKAVAPDKPVMVSRVFEEPTAPVQPVVAPVAEPATETVEEEIPDDFIVDDEETVYMDAEGNIFSILLNKSFTAKIIQADETTQGYYTALKNEALAYEKAKSRISWTNDSVNAGRSQALKFAVKGKTLCVYFALDPETYADSKYKVERSDAVKSACSSFSAG